jgi:hypothetical protein
MQIGFIGFQQIHKKMLAHRCMHNNPELAMKFIFMSKERRDC